MDYWLLFFVGLPFLFLTIYVAYQYLVKGKAPVMLLTMLHWIVTTATSAYFGLSAQSTAIWFVLTFLFLAVISFTLWCDYENGTAIGSQDEYKRFSFSTTAAMVYCVFAVSIVYNLSVYLG